MAEWLAGAYDDGAVLVCDVVYAELAPFFGDRLTLDGALCDLGVRLSPMDSAIAWEGGVGRGRRRSVVGEAAG